MSIEFKDVIKRYGKTLAVDNLNLTINEGEIFGLLGPNGAGKSTTNKMLVGLLKPDSGKISVNGLDVLKKGIQVRKLLTIVPQELAIYEDLSARENVNFFGKLHGLRGKELNKKTDAALEFTGLIDKQKIKSKKFSGGMKRRLNIACAIVNKPKIIIMDEPTVGIDPQSRNHILESVKILNEEGMTIIYTSHYMEEVESICTRIGIMDYGKLMTIGSNDELKRQLDQEEKVILKVTDIGYTIVEELKQLYDVSNAYIDGDELVIITNNTQGVLMQALAKLSKHNTQVQKIDFVKLTLEDVFLSLTGRKLRD